MKRGSIIGAVRHADEEATMGNRDKQRKEPKKPKQPKKPEPKLVH